MQSIEFPSDTDGALSPPVRSNYNTSTSVSRKRKFSVLESRATHAGSAKRQQTLTAFHQASKGGSYQHHMSSGKSLDEVLQKGRAANNIHSNAARPAGGISFNGNQSELQKQIDARRKAAAAAQDRQRATARKERDAAQEPASDKAKRAAARQRLDDHRAEQGAWNDRASAVSRPSTFRPAELVSLLSAADDRNRSAAASQRLEDGRAEQDAWLDRSSVTARTPASRPAEYASLPSTAPDREHFAAVTRRLEMRHAEQDAFINHTTAARNSTSRPTGHSSLPNAGSTRPRPTAVTMPFPRPSAPKQPLSIFDQISADAKRARERKKREVEARKEQTRALSDDITDSQAQREAEENHAISRPPPYQSLRRINTTPETNHAITRPRSSEPSRTTNTIPKTNDDAKSQADPDDELVLEPNTLPQGPFSLNSAAGVRAIKKSLPRPPPMNLPFDDDGLPTKTTTQRFMGTGTPKTKLSLKKPSRHQDLLPITASDLKLYQWREQKIQWAEVRQLYSDYTGITPLKSEDTLRYRFRQISKVVELGVVTDEMCERVINGDEVATAELNRLAGQYAYVPGSTASSAGLEAAPFRKIVKQTPAPRSVTVPPPPAAHVVPRPTRGGKTLDHDTYLIYLNYRDVTDDDSDTDSRAGSPPAPEDCVHWEYYIERRNLYSEDLDADFEELDETTLWCELNASFGHAGHANAEASKFIFTTPDGSPAILRLEEEWKLTFLPLEEGMSFWTLQTGYGMVQVRVCRRMLSWQDHVMPETKEGWVPKTLYGVFVKKTQRLKRIVKRVVKKMVEKAAAAEVAASDKDSLFGDDDEKEDEDEEAQQEEEEWYDGNVEFYQADDYAVYGSLDQANQEAIKEWVRLTMKPSSANLDEFACRCVEARQELQRRLGEAGDGTAFKMVMEDGEKTVEVFARALTMKGARN
jgi:hypothetical protein